MNKIEVALIGNPNVGKTTLFNKLCGVNQKTGNYTGVTIDKKKGEFEFKNTKIQLIDLPGFSSLNPKSKDEELVLEFLIEKYTSNKIDKILFVADATNFKKNLYLLTQIRDLGYEIVLAINLIDVAKKQGIFFDIPTLKEELGVEIIEISARKGNGVDDLKNSLISQKTTPEQLEITYLKEENHAVLKEIAKENNIRNLYATFFQIINGQITYTKEIEVKKWQNKEAILRYQNINKIVSKTVRTDKSKASDLTSRLDKFFLHKIGGYLIFFLILLVIFQSVFSLASYPMDLIDSSFAWLSEKAGTLLPSGRFSDLISEGLIPGIGGVAIFVPQIVILFFFFALLEESGYMSRIVFLMDKSMQKIGMSGKSIVPLISSFACAVPAIMASRTIENKRDRLITILVAPLLTCSARLPVYTILIGLLVPNDYYYGISIQALILLGMYFVGIFMTVLAALVFKIFIKSKYKSFFILEMPQYLRPNFKNILYTVWENSISFVVNAGKIIIAASVILYVLATTGGTDFKNAENYVTETYQELNAQEKQETTASIQLEKSYLGMLGKSIEPAIEPLGYDWKIGIALISSIAAREVFVGTISIIYNINSEEDLTIMQRLATEKNANTGNLTFNFATIISLLLFYAFSLQCMSTIAITYKETKSVKWTAIQFIYMTALAYFVALIAYQILK